MEKVLFDKTVSLEFEVMRDTVAIVRDGTAIRARIDYEEARKLWAELNEEFGQKYEPPQIIPYVPNAPIPRDTTIALYGCLPPDTNISYQKKGE